MIVSVKIIKKYKRQLARAARRSLLWAEKRRKRFDMRLKVFRRRLLAWQKSYRRFVKRAARKSWVALGDYVFELRNYKISVIARLKAEAIPRKKPGDRRASLAMTDKLPALRPRAASALLLLAILGYGGLFNISLTHAYFSDREDSADNTFAAASLDFSIDSPDDFAPPVTPTDDALREAAVNKDGSLGFSYKISAQNFTGDSSLCDALNLSAALDGGSPTTEPLSTFEIGPFDFGAPEDWDFTAALTSSDESLREKTCNFDLVFSGWQQGLGEGNGGFTDEEVLPSTITSGTWAVDSCVTDPGDIISSVMTGSSFGTNGHNLIVASGGELKSPTTGGTNGVITVSTDCDVTVQSGGKIKAAKGNGKGGTMTISARNFTVDAGGIVSASSTASGKDGGTATVTTTGDFTVNGTFSANGHDGGGSIIVDSSDDISVSGSSLTATGTNKDGGSIILSADDDITVPGLVSTSAKDQGGTVVILAGGDLAVPVGGSVLAESTNKKGGTVEMVVNGGGTIAGTVSADGHDGDGLITMTIQGNLDVSATGIVKADTTAGGKDGGRIGIKVRGVATYSGIVRTNATDNGKILVLWSEGAATISGTASVNGGTGGGDKGGLLHIISRGLLTISGTASATGTVAGSVQTHYASKDFTGGTITPAATERTITLHDIVLNEVVANVTGNDKGSAGNPLDGEWIELYNKGLAPVDVNGWVLVDIDGDELTIAATNSDNNGNLSDGGETIVPAGGVLTVYRNGNNDFDLADDGKGELIRLYDASPGSGGVLRDSFSYVIDVATDQSIARMPDGTGAWVDPEPTPTALNGGINIDELRAAFLARILAQAENSEETAASDLFDNSEAGQATGEPFIFILPLTGAGEPTGSTTEILLDVPAVDETTASPADATTPPEVLPSTTPTPAAGDEPVLTQEDAALPDIGEEASSAEGPILAATEPPAEPVILPEEPQLAIEPETPPAITTEIVPAAENAPAPAEVEPSVEAAPAPEPVAVSE